MKQKKSVLGAATAIIAIAWVSLTGRVQGQQILLNIGDSTYPTAASPGNYIYDAGQRGVNSTGISLTNAISTFAPAYNTTVAAGSHSFGGGQTITLSASAGSYAKNTAPGDEPDGLMDLYLYYTSTTANTVKIGNLNLQTNATYNLYVYGWIPNNGTNEDSVFTPLNDNADITYASTAASNGLLVVQFSTSANYTNTDTVDFNWAKISGKSDGVLNGLAIVQVNTNTPTGPTAWSGNSSSDWNTAANWTNGVPNGVAATINLNSPNVATITTAIPIPLTVTVGGTAGATGQVDQISSIVTNVLGMTIGVSGGGGVYNLADTTTGGGATSGYGQGSGSLLLQSGNLEVGNDTGSYGIFNMNTTGSVSTTTNMEIQVGVNGTGTFNMDSGIINSGSSFVVGLNSGSVGVMNISGGTVNVANYGTGHPLILGALSVSAQGTLNLAGAGVVNIIGAGNLCLIGNEGAGILNVSNSAVLNATNTSGIGLGSSGGVATVNLNGGTIITTKINQGSGSGTFNFNGGILEASTSTTNFMSGLYLADVMPGGAIINDGGFNISIGQFLGNSDSGGLTKLGSGTLTLAGGYSYTGPTLVLNGALNLNASQASSGSALTVSNATLNILLNNGNSSISAYNGNVTLDGSTVLNLNYGTATSPTGNPAINAGGQTVNNAGTCTINIVGSYLTPGEYQLIYTGGSVPTNGFIVGTTPTGVSAVLANSGQSLDLLITASVQHLAWYGADNAGNPLTNWDINISTNWNYGNAKYQQYAANDYGDYVTFDDTLYNSSDASITLNTNVVPLSVTFNNNSTPYSITGSGGINGATSLVLNGTNSIYLGTSNNFAGGTIINAGTLVVTNDNALGINSGLVALSGGTLRFSNSTVSVRGFTVVSNSTIRVAANANAQLSGLVSGSAALMKMGNGTLTLADTNTYTGTTAVNGGTLNISGTINAANTANSSAVIVASNANARAVMNISGTVNDNNGFLRVGAGDSACGVININGGTLSTLSELQPGAADTAQAGFGSLVVNSGIVNVGTFLSIGRSLNSGGMSRGEFVNNGGTVNVTANDFAIGAWQNISTNTSVATLMGGNTTVGTNGGWCYVGEQANGILNIMGNAALSILNTNRSLSLGSSYSGVNGIVNLDGGTVLAPAVAQGSGGVGTFNFNGGTVKASKANANFMTGLTGSYVYKGGGTIDNNGYAITIGQALLAPTGSGVSIGSFTAGGTNYIAPPIIEINGGGGVGATAIAQIDYNGVITNVIITCPGIGYTNTPAVNYYGGGGTGSPIITLALTSNTSGGMTFQGAGTTILTGTNTYVGNTTVNAGTLELAQNIPTFATNSTIFIAGTAVLQLDSGTVTNVVENLITNGIAAGNGLYNYANSSGLIYGRGYLQVGAIPSGPALSSLMPNPVTGSSYALTLSVTGSGFVSGCSVLLTNLTTSTSVANTVTFNSSTNLSIEAILGTTSSSWNATVVNPDLTASGQLGFVVTAPAAVRISQTDIESAGTGKIVLSGTGGTSGYSYVVLGATNIDPPVLWAPVVTNVFDGNGNFAYTNAVNTGTSKLFLRVAQ